jgi:alpha-beta hydrolase superfamily lysophospholipase
VLAKLTTLLKWLVVVLTVMVATILVWRIVESQRGAPLELWHTFVPPELDATQLDATDWQGYLAAEQKAFDEVRSEVTERLDPDPDRPVNRHAADSPIYPGRFRQDWNRSYTLEPTGPARGAVVLLHGLTDSPYSLRHIGRRYQELGWFVIAPRLPGHGTVPAGLVEVVWQDWAAATRLAVREARRRVGPDAPLHLVGFSNGGALAVDYALDALDDPQLARPDRLVLISPMIGITVFARFAGIAAWPAVLPAFAKAAWLGIVPEFNPFKYNSFPVNGARQSHLLTRALQAKIDRRARDGRIEGLPPILTFQSVIDFTVSTRAVIRALYERLPANGSELVLFDLNRSTKIGLLFARRSETAIARLLPSPPRAFRTTVVTNADPSTARVVARVTEPGESVESVVPLGLDYPRDVFSLSHVALPFPITDPLYGLQPDGSEDFGIELGDTAPRGERGTLIVSLDSLLRMSSNPFFPFLMERIEGAIGSPAPG